MGTGIRGRKPTAPNLHLLTNPNWRAKQKERKEYPEPEGPPPKEPPDWLSFEAREEWRRVMEAMGSTGVYTAADLSALAQYCYWFGQFRWLNFLAETEHLPPYTTTAIGGLKEHPIWRMIREASRKTLDFAAHLGLTPAARTRLGQEKKGDGEDPFSKHEAKAPTKRRPGRPRKQTS